MWRKGFQPVKWGVASDTERGATGLAAKGLDRFSVTMHTIPEQDMDRSVCNPEVLTLVVVGTGEALGVYAFGSSSPAFDLAPGTHGQRRWTRTC